jgi:CRISPR/Cas system-associated exonuclease Cas4 (RecB family)
MISYASLFNLLVHLDGEEDSHTELNPHVFHPSQLANTCPRQVYLQKLGLVEIPPGAARVGSLIHEFICDNLPQLSDDHSDVLRQLGIDPNHVDALEFEEDTTIDLGGIVLTGRYDLYDPREDVIVDWKTKDDLERLHLPIKEDIEQVTLYMHMVGASRAKLVYIQRTDLASQAFPARDDNRHTVDFDRTRFKRLIARAWHVRQAIETHGIATAPDEIPFDRCGCWKCRREDETLALPDNPPAFKFPPRSDPPDCLDEATLKNVDS